MKVVLREDVEKLGRKGDLLEVADGYARNYLVPRGPGDRTRRRAWSARPRPCGATARSATTATRAPPQELATRLTLSPVQVTARAGEGGKLFGSVTSADIVAAVAGADQGRARPPQGHARRAAQGARAGRGAGAAARGRHGHARGRGRRRIAGRSAPSPTVLRFGAFARRVGGPRRCPTPLVHCVGTGCPQGWGQPGTSSTTNSQGKPGLLPLLPTGGNCEHASVARAGHFGGTRGVAWSSRSKISGRAGAAPRASHRTTSRPRSRCSAPCSLSRDAITAAVEARVDASDFYKPAYGHIFEAVWSLYEQGEPVDPVTVAEELRRAGLLEALGGKGTLTQIQASTPASANAGHYAKIVSELALLRRLITVSGEIAEIRVQPARRRHRDRGPGRGDGLRGRREARSRSRWCGCSKP